MVNILRWWNRYKYRFVPWIALNLKERSIRSVEGATQDKVLCDAEILDNLLRLFTAFREDIYPTENRANHSDQEQYQNASLQKNSNFQKHGETEIDMTQIPKDRRYSNNLLIMERILGYQIERLPSKIEGGGTGVVVTKGKVNKGSLVSMYPGAIYHPYEPILLQSMNNPFIFRCIDGMLIDGNDKGLSKFLYKSCSGRDRVGPYEICDRSWVTSYPHNPLAVGQYVNNHNKAHPANVAYQELDIPLDFPIHLRKFIPNVFYSSVSSTGNSSAPRLCRVVVLVSTSDIEQGEELFSSYFTVVH